MTAEIDINVLKDKIEDLLVKYGIGIDRTTDRRGRGEVYSVSTRDASMKITLGGAWIGYELHVNKGVAGKSADIFLDTDNYPLTDKHKVMAKNVFDNLYCALDALLGHKVYVGVVEGKTTIAVPQADGMYKVTHKGRFVSKQRVLGKSDLGSIPGLSPLL